MRIIQYFQRDNKVDKLQIPYPQNKCHKILKIILKNKNIIECAPIIGVFCEISNENGMCAFDIQIYISGLSVIMTPKKMHCGTMSIRKNDYDEMRITGQNVHSFSIVLNGERIFMRKNENRSCSKKSILLLYYNDYIPIYSCITNFKILQMPKKNKNNPQESITGFQGNNE